MKNVFLKRAFSLVMALTLVITFACVLQAAPQTARAASMDVMIVIGESARPFFDKTSIDMSWNTAQTVEDLLENLYRWQMNANKSEFETSDIIVKNGNTVIPHSRKLGDIAGGSGVTLTIEIPNAACLFVYNYEGFSESGDVGSRYYPPNSVLDEVPALMPETYDGHAFLGWYTDEACQTSPQFPLTLSQNVTFYAKWEHTPGEPVQENITDATCTQDGSYDEVTYCGLGENCTVELSRESRTIPAYGHEWGEWETTVPATADASGVETRVCQRDGCSEKEERDIPQLIVYSETEGDGSEWTPDNGEGLLLIFERSFDDEETFSHFTGVKVDGNELDEADYTAEPGSVKITLAPAYLKTLSPGEHTLSVSFNDGEDATAKFIIAGNGQDAQPSGGAPKTGDGNPIMVWAFAALISAGFAAGAALKLRDDHKE